MLMYYFNNRYRIIIAVLMVRKVSDIDNTDRSGLGYDLSTDLSLSLVSGYALYNDTRAREGINILKYTQDNDSECFSGTKKSISSIYRIS